MARGVAVIKDGGGEEKEAVAVSESLAVLLAALRALISWLRFLLPMYTLCSTAVSAAAAAPALP